MGRFTILGSLETNLEISFGILYNFRPSPKLVLIILQLCRVALPLMSAESCERVELPSWGADIYASYPHSSLPEDDESAVKSTKIASLLLAKLGDFLTPGMYLGGMQDSIRKPNLLTM